MSLETEIEDKRKEIKTDEYPMSIGEITSLYTASPTELDIHPEFQREFRWEGLQKTKLIESIFLGIPIPPIFVSQRTDGIWEVIDGVQRLSTIFEFIGELRDDKGCLKEPSRLIGTDYLPLLENKIWKDEHNRDNQISDALKRTFKRAKLNFVIVKEENDPDAKYELFQRINTLGSRLTNQEVRNCLLLMVNPEFFKWIKSLSTFEPFQKCICLSDKLLDEKYDIELLLRFIVYKNSNIPEIKKAKDVDDFLTKTTIKFAKEPSFNKELEAKIFENTFSLLNKILGPDVFKRYNRGKQVFEGKFLVSAFEVIAIGLGKNILSWEDTTPEQEETLKNKIRSIWADPTFTGNSGSGLNAKMRLPTLLPYGEELFRDGSQNP